MISDSSIAGERSIENAPKAQSEKTSIPTRIVDELTPDAMRDVAEPGAVRSPMERRPTAPNWTRTRA